MTVIISRHQIDSTAWDACVAASAQRIIYGFSWYLDAVLPGPDWKWVGVIQVDADGVYRAVLPVPLRQKWGVWRVHQPFFCQILGLFSRDPVVDPTPFYQMVYDRYRYGSVWQIKQYPPHNAPVDLVQQRSTQVLGLSATYPTIRARYTSDRRRNLRRAKAFGWTVDERTDIEPLLRLFRTHHAPHIDGGVGSWAYEILRNLFADLHRRGKATLLYAQKNGRIEAGALFVRDDTRIVYLFNAATEAGRRGNARTLLIDQLIQHNAGQRNADAPGVLDFESPEKLSVRAFYASFGAVPQLFWSVRWNRLAAPERWLRWLLKRLLKRW